MSVLEDPSTLLHSRPTVSAAVNATPGSPLNSLPTDVLFSIFLACLKGLERQSYPRSRGHPIFSLSQVSREWRELALSIPALWSVIDVDVPPLNLPGGRIVLGATPWKLFALPSLTRWTQLFLYRSGEHPLTVRLTIPRVPSGIREAHDEIGSLFGLLSSHSSRWQGVRIICEGPFAEFLIPLLLRLRPQYLPQLESIALEDQRSRGNLGPSFEIVGMRTPSRKLKLSISVSSIYMGDTLRLVDQFVDEWGLLSPPTVSTLHFHPPDIFRLLHVLGRYSNLTKCSLDTSQFAHALAAANHAGLISFAHAGHNQVVLPQLETLHLHGECLVHNLSPFFDLPQLRSLSIDPRMSGDSEPSFLEWGARFGAQLTHVTIGGGTLSQQSVLAFLRGMYNLTHLKIIQTRDQWGCRTTFDSMVWQGLTPKPDHLGRSTGDDCPCPNLQVLHCPMPTGVVVESSRLERALVSFVVARRTVEEHDQVAQLRELRLEFHEATPLRFKARFARLLQETGVNEDGFLWDFSSDLRNGLTGWAREIR
ncbi:hypothetical protein NMY22_g7960 [Coprinellus aureogranulatus]|nr:hypothetical protein NMY22_g7960 [Coprinellus aureogranulatus]